MTFISASLEEYHFTAWPLEKEKEKNNLRSKLSQIWTPNQDATGIKFLTGTGTGTGIYYFFNRNRTGTGISLRKIDRYRNRNRYEEYIFTPL